MKLVFPCFVVSVAVLIAVFGCKTQTQTKEVANIEPPRGTQTFLHHDGKSRHVYFIRKPGDDSLVFECNIIAAQADFIVKERSEKKITYHNAESFLLDIGTEKSAPLLTDIMLANKDFDSSKTIGNIALIKLQRTLDVNYEDKSFVKQNLGWIHENFDRVERAESPSDLIQQINDEGDIDDKHDAAIEEMEVLTANAFLTRNFGTEVDDKVCPAYFLRKKGDTASPYVSEVFVTEASCIVKDYSQGKFEYYESKYFRLVFLRKLTSLNGNDEIDDSRMIANEEYVMDQEGSENDVALVPLKRRRKVTYSIEHTIVTKNQDWIDKKLRILFPKTGYTKKVV